MITRRSLFKSLFALAVVPVAVKLLPKREPKVAVGDIVLPFDVYRERYIAPAVRAAVDESAKGVAYEPPDWYHATELPLPSIGSVWVRQPDGAIEFYPLRSQT